MFCLGPIVITKAHELTAQGSACQYSESRRIPLGYPGTPTPYFFIPSSHPSGFKWGQQCSWTHERHSEVTKLKEGFKKWYYLY